jgi:hypothetical protein
LRLYVCLAPAAAVVTAAATPATTLQAEA